MNILEHKAIKELQAASIPFTVKGNEVILDGFSKSGTATLTFKPMDNDEFESSNSGCLWMKTRYNEITNIYDLKSIVTQAWSWYFRGMDNGYKLPEIWKDEFVKAGYIRIEQQVIEQVFVL